MTELKATHINKRDVDSFTVEYIEYLYQLLLAVDKTKLAELIDILVGACQEGRHIFFIGNGGSAATASHFANDISLGSGSFVNPFKVSSLCDNSAIITAVANDYGYDHIFSKQLANLMSAGDVVVAISASGNSRNVIEAVEYAKTHDGMTIALTGFDGGRLKEIAHLVVHVPTQKGEYGVTEDIHAIIDHLISTFLKRLSKANEGR